MRFTRLPLATQLLIVMVGTVVLAIALMGTLTVFLASEVVQEEGDQRLIALTQTASDLIAAPLVGHDTAGIKRILTAAVREEGLDRAFVLAPDGTVVAAQLSVRVDADDISPDDQDFALGALRTGQLRSRDGSDNLVDIAVPIVVNGQTVGLVLGQSRIGGAIEEISGTALPQVGVAGVGMMLLAALAAWVVARYIAAPLRKLASLAIAVGQGQLESMPNLRGSAEVGALASAFGQMLEDLHTTRAAVVEQQRTLETRVNERTADLERTLAELRESVTAREQLSATVRDMASPVVPVLDGILVMPLVGVIDSGRAALLMEALLGAVERHRASMVILDVTGVPIIDSQVAQTLLAAAGAVKLIGAQTILVGLRPELAQTIVGLGLDLSGLRTQADLQSGVSYAMRQQQR